MQPYRHGARCSTAPDATSALPPLRPLAVACALAWLALPSAHATTIAPGDDVQVSSPAELTDPLVMTGGQLTTLSTMTLGLPTITFDGSLGGLISLAAGTGTTLTLGGGMQNWLNAPIVRINLLNQTGTVEWAPAAFTMHPSTWIAIDGGTLRYGNAAAAAAGAAAELMVVGSGTTLDLGSHDAELRSLAGGGVIDTGHAANLTLHDGSFGGRIIGDANLTVSGGTLTLAGNNAYAGSTTIDGAFLVVGGGGTSGTLGSNPGPIQNNGRLVFDRSDTYVLGNQVTGTGELQKRTGGTLVLTADNSYNGWTYIDGGTLQVGNGGTTGSLGAGSVANNGTLSFARSDDVTLGNWISGGGGLEKLGTGLLVLTANNDYLGPTHVAGGTLQVGVGGTTGTLGQGAVNNEGRLVFDRSDTSTVGNAISGGGSMELRGGGTFVLTGDNSGHFGDMTIQAGTTVRVGDGGGTGVLGTGNVTNNHALVFDRTGGYVVAGDIGGTGSVTVTGNGLAYFTGNNTYAGTTTIDAGNQLMLGLYDTRGSLGLGAVTNNGQLLFTRSDTLVVGNAINGSGDLLQLGFGTTVLTGPNGYTGETLISDGTLQVGAGGTSGNLGSGRVVNQSALSFNRSDTVTFANRMVGSGTLEQAGSGTLVLTGDNSAFTGATTIRAGTLQVGDGGTDGSLGTYTGTIVNDGTLAFRRSNSVLLLNKVTGSGNLEQAGGPSSVLALGADNEYTGTTTIRGGALQVGTGGSTGSMGTGAVVNDGDLAFYRSDQHVVANDISGTGTLWAVGTGPTVLTGNNSYQGGTMIYAGATLQVGTGGTDGTLGTGGVSNQGALVFDRSDTLIVGGTISNSATGTLRHAGSGTLVITGTVFGGAGVTIDRGTLQVGNGATTGNIGGPITNNGALVFDRSDAGAFLGSNVSGSGSLTHAGTGTLTLTGTNTYAGPTTVAGGRLNVGNGGTTGSLGGGDVFNDGVLAFNRSDAITVGNTITGSGSLVKLGGDALVLTADNAYAGTTSIFSGTVRVGAGGTTGSLGTGAVTNNAELVFDRADRHVVANTINGGGNVSTVGAGTLVLTGDNNYAGTTSIAAGSALQVGDGGSSGSVGLGRVINEGNLVYDRGDTHIVYNAIEGSGDLRVAGSGITTFAGEHTYTGTTRIDAGATLRTSYGVVGARLAGGAIVNDGTLELRRAETVADAISGNGRLVVADAITLAGDNSYAGDTIISASTLTVGDGGTHGSLGSGAVTNDAVLAFNRSDTRTVANAIHGAGNLVQAGTGTLVLTGANDYAGTTLVNAGTTLQVGDGGSSGALGGGTITVAGGAALLFNRNDAHVVAGPLAGSGSLGVGGGGTTILAGNGGFDGAATIAAGSTLQLGNGGAGGGLGAASVVNDGTLRFARGDAHTVSASIAGSGSVVAAGTGTTTLTGNNSYTGATSIAAGATLQVGAGGTAGTLGSGALNNDGMLAINRSDSVTFNTAINGLGSFTQAGGGTTILTADNGYAGSTIVSGGTLQVGTGGTTGTLGGGNVTLANGASLAIQRGGTYTVANSIAGTGSLQANGSGTLILTGNNSYTGTTDIAAGLTVRVGDGGTSGSLGTGDTRNLGVLRFERSDVHVVDSAIVDAGSVVIAGSGTTVMRGANSYAGGTTILSGATLQVGDGSTNGGLGSGGISNEGVLAFNPSTTLLAANAIHGSGGVVHMGGVLGLFGDNDYTGGTRIAAGGFLVAGNGGTQGRLGRGTVVNDGMLAVYRADTVTLPDRITGHGDLWIVGAGTVVLGADNDYRNTTIDGGILQVGNGGTAGSLGIGNVINNAVLAFNRSDTIPVANAIDGTGSLVQSGRGNLVLTAANTYTGGTFVNAGTLSVNGSIVGDTTVNSGGTLGGTGTVGNVTVASGGRLAPGNSIGTLSVNGNLSFGPGSIYRVEANAAGAADRVNTVGAGTITINGGTVDVQAGGAGYQRNTRYTILSSGGTTTGGFANATTNLAFLTPTLIYEANAVLLDLEAKEEAAYVTAARTRNQAAVANYLQSFAAAPGNTQAAGLIQQIDNMTADQAAASFESMAGSAHASASQVASALGRNFSATLAARSGFGTAGLGNAMNDWSRVHYASLDRSRFEPATVASDVVAQAGPARGVETPLASAVQRGLWAQALGAGGRLDADGNAAGSRYGSSGFVLGYDQPVSGRWLAGGALGYATSHWNTTSGDSASGRIESPQAGLYARYAGDTLRVRVDGTFARHDFTTDRTVSLAGAVTTANSTHKGREWALGGQVEMPVQAGDWELRPLAGVRYAHLQEDGFSETGQGAANLTVAARTTQNTLLSAGMHFVRLFNQGKGGIELRAVASHLAGDNDSPVTGSIAGQPGSFTASGVPLERNALTLGATVSGEFTRRVSAYLDANYELRGSGQDAYRLTAGVRVSF